MKKLLLAVLATLSTSAYAVCPVGVTGQQSSACAEANVSGSDGASSADNSSSTSTLANPSIATNSSGNTHSADGRIDSAISGSNSLTGGTNTVHGGATNVTTGATSQSQSTGATTLQGGNLGLNQTYRNVNIPQVPLSIPVGGGVIGAPVVMGSGQATGGLTQQVLSCGALQQIKATDVNGTFIGFFKTNSGIPLGVNQELAPNMVDGQHVRYWTERDEVNGIVNVWGHQPIITWSVLPVSGARNFSLGGGGNGGSWVNGGGGASSGMARTVSQVQLRDCLVSSTVIAKPVVVEKEVIREVIVEKPAATKAPVARVYKRKAKKVCNQGGQYGRHGRRV